MRECVMACACVRATERVCTGDYIWSVGSSISVVPKASIAIVYGASAQVTASPAGPVLRSALPTSSRCCSPFRFNVAVACSACHAQSSSTCGCASQCHAVSRVLERREYSEPRVRREEDSRAVWVLVIDSVFRVLYNRITVGAGRSELCSAVALQHRRNSQKYALVEAGSLLYRSLLPISIWYA